MKYKILAIDDDEKILRLIANTLKANNFHVETRKNIEEINICDFTGFDLILLDVMMPISGLEICRSIRSQITTPILFLTAKDFEEDLLKGIQAGADDYITKPFKLGVLVSRINALLRRPKGFNSTDTELQSNGIKVLMLQGQVFKNEKLIDLTAAEYKLLCLFMKNPNVVLTKEQILDKLWDCEGNYIDSSTLTVYMRRLRMKIEDNPSEPQMLLTVRRMGYKWNVLG